MARNHIIKSSDISAVSMKIIMLNQRVIPCEYIRLMAACACVSLKTPLVPRLSAPRDYYKKGGSSEIVSLGVGLEYEHIRRQSYVH